MPAIRTYTPTTDYAGAPELNETSVNLELRGDTPVTVVHRGGPDVVDMWDSRVWRIPSDPTASSVQYQGRPVFRVRYDVALHLKRRAIVPGTQSPYATQRGDIKTSSQLAILAPKEVADRADRCGPLSDALLLNFGGHVEAIDRGAFASPADRTVVVLPAHEGLTRAMTGGRNVEADVAAAEQAPEIQAGGALGRIAEETAAFRDAQRAGEVSGTETVSQTRVPRRTR